MSKARDLANILSVGILADGAIAYSEVTGTPTLPSVTSGSLTKSFASGEEATITLTQNISPAPVVSVTKEVAQPGLSSKGSWDVNSTGSNYDIYDYAENVTLSVNASSKLVKSAGSWTASELNKNIKVAAGGSLWVTATDGTYVEEVAPSYPVAAGGWTLVNVEVDAVNGLSLASRSSGYDFNAMTIPSSSNVLNIQNTDSGARGFSFTHSGSRIYMVGSTGDRVYRYDLTTAYDITTATYVQQSGVICGPAPECVQFKSDGLKMFTFGIIFKDIRVYTLTSAFDITTATYDGASGDLYINAGGTSPKDFQFKYDGTAIYTVASNSTDISVWALPTAWVPSSGSSRTAVSFSSHCSDIHSIEFQQSGKKLMLLTRSNNSSNAAVLVFDLGTAWDVSTATLTANSNGFNTTGWTNLNGDITSTSAYCARSNLDGSKIFVMPYNQKIYEINTVGISSSSNQYAIATTNSGGQINTTSWLDINSMAADENLNSGEAYYAVSTDNHATWSVGKSTDGVRQIVRNNSGTWQYNNNATYASTTWANSIINDEINALDQALTAQANNRMNSTQLASVADANHFVLSTTLDLAVALRASATTSVPNSDGVTINYDNEAKNEGAVIGTDYDFDFPAANTVKIKANAALNLKIRVI